MAFKINAIAAGIVLILFGFAGNYGVKWVRGLVDAAPAVKEFRFLQMILKKAAAGCYHTGAPDGQSNFMDITEVGLNTTETINLAPDSVCNSFNGDYVVLNNITANNIYSDSAYTGYCTAIEQDVSIKNRHDWSSVAFSGQKFNFPSNETEDHGRRYFNNTVGKMIWKDLAADQSIMIFPYLAPATAALYKPFLNLKNKALRHAWMTDKDGKTEHCYEHSVGNAMGDAIIAKGSGLDDTEMLAYETIDCFRAPTGTYRVRARCLGMTAPKMRVVGRTFYHPGNGLNLFATFMMPMTEEEQAAGAREIEPFLFFSANTVAPTDLLLLGTDQFIEDALNAIYADKAQPFLSLRFVSWFLSFFFIIVGLLGK